MAQATMINELDATLNELSAAIRAGDWARAAELQIRAMQQMSLASEQLHQHERTLAELSQRIDSERAGTVAGDALSGTSKVLVSISDAAASTGTLTLDHVSATGDVVEESAESLEPDEQGRDYHVWYGTNRSPVDEGDPSKGFGSERSAQTRYGKVTVAVPKAHRFGETGNSWFKRLRRFEFRDDHLRMKRIEPQTSDESWQSLQAEKQSALSAGLAGDALVFIHGYKNSFEDAAIRAAQLAVDLRVPGATAFFSWPSRGTLQGYAADEATIDASEGAITNFLVDFVKRSGSRKVHLVAHSMGNRALLRALQRIAANSELQGVRFGQIFLAAPDVDRDLFMELASVYPARSERTTIYVSKADRAVHLSSKIHDAPRVGYYLPYTVVKEIDTISVPDFDIDFLGHAMFAQAAGLLHDIYDLLRNNVAPSQRQRLSLVAGQTSVYEVGL